MWLLAANYDTQLLGNATSWTHGPYNPDSGAEVNIVISKPPLMWVPSMYRYEKSNLLKSLYIPDAIKRWNTLYKGYMKDCPKETTFFLPYDALLKYPEDMMGLVAIELGLTQKEGRFKVAEGYMGKQMNETEKKFDVKHYTESSYLDWYSKEDIQLAQSFVDWEVADFVGKYKKL